jgi:hypothetical protein
MTGHPELTGFSVVIPTFNRSGHLAACLAPFLEPEAAGIEVIVVDDGSTDDTVAVVAGLAAQSRGADIRCEVQANAGPGAARNRGAALARGDWIVLLDSDDRWFGWTVGVVRETLAQAGEAGILFLSTHSFTEDAALAGVKPGPVVRVAADGFVDAWGRRMLPMLGSCNVAIRRDLYEASGGFEPSIRGHEDYDLFCRVPGAVLCVTEPPMLGYREGSPGSLTANTATMLEGMLFLLEGLETGRYIGPRAELERLMGAKALLWIRIFFERGSADAAYALWRQALPLLLRTVGAATALKVAGTPLFAKLGVGNYRFGTA